MDTVSRAEYDKLQAQYEELLKKQKNERNKYTTVSGEPIELLYTPSSVSNNFTTDISFPGMYPFTRGIHPTGYRGKMFTMRQFAGFGSPEDTNERFHYLLKNGQSGLSVAFDLPTLMGWDSDAELAKGEVGICGVSISSIQDMDVLFRNIPLDEVSVSMTINSPAAMIFAFYLGIAKQRGIGFEKLRGTMQNDILKEYIAQKEYIYPPLPSMRIVTDMIEYCTREVPQWNPVSVSGYHIREAGSTAVQELAYTLADGFAYIEDAIKRGLDVDEFAPRISFFFNSHLDFFEEVAKFRAARRIFAKRMKEKYGAKNPRSWWLRFHTQTAGCTLTAQQPENNIVRTAMQGLAAVLGGTQSLHTNSMDETLALPSEKAVKIALRTQQIIAYETGVTASVDPLGGSYMVEHLTDRMEKQAEEIFNEIDALGGVIEAIESGYFQKNIGEAAYRYQKEVERKEKIIVGVNEFVEADEKIDIPLLTVSPEVEIKQRRQLSEMKQQRDSEVVNEALAQINKAAVDQNNLMPHFVHAALNNVTMGEMIEELKHVYGTYEETIVF